MKWITGDVHVHSHSCSDGTLPVEEIVRQSKKYCDFIAISGHATVRPDWGEQQYREIAAARRIYPDMPIFHTAEQEFPIERHTMFLTIPNHREVELQQELIRRYHRLSGATGIEKAVEELQFVEQHWGTECLMIFNHPGAPDVSFADFERLARASKIFKIIACLDRGERRARQTWDIGGEWDKLLLGGHRIFARCGSDFHAHFTTGGHDYWPGEFVQDHLRVENNTYSDIIAAYRDGRFFCTVARIIENPVWEFATLPVPGSTEHTLRLSFQTNLPLEQVEIIADARPVATFRNITADFAFEGKLPAAGYYRVRGTGKMQKRPYQDGEFEPIFLLNPLFTLQG